MTSALLVVDVQNDVVDGMPGQDTGDGIVPDALVRALLNRTWSSLRHPGRTVDVVLSAAVVC